MGWIGYIDKVQHVLSTIGADKDQEGKFLIYGKPPVTFLGIGEEMLISDQTEYSVKKQRFGLAVLMNSTSYGLKVNVI